MRIRQMLIGALALVCACAFGAGTNELSVKAGDPLASARMMRLRNALKAGTHTGPETATEKTRKAIAKLFPGWSLDTEVYDHDWSGIQSYHRGKRNVTFVHPKNKGTPSVISRTVKLSGNNPCLSLSVASLNDDADFLLSVRVNGKDALSNRIVCTTDAVPWEDIVVPLSDWRGSMVKIEVVFTANGWSCEFPYLARVDIIEADGDMSINEGKCEVDGYTWSYRAQNGEATIVAENDGRFSAVSPCPVGSITIPATIAGAKVTHIGRDAFLDCSALTSVTIPEGVSRIGRGAFHDCTGLKSIKIPSSVKIIERDAFLGCNALSSVSIPEGVTSIERGTFDWCCGLESIEIPSGVTQIGGSAFAWCKGLTSVTIPERVTDIGDSAFHGCNALTSVTISASVTNINHVAFRNTGALTTFQVDPGNRYYKSENGLLLSKDGTTLVRGVNGDATIPPSVTAIGNCAFEGCVALRSAEIPSGVKSIGPFAFKQCRGMTSLTIPSSVTDIGREAFSNCKGLKSIAIPQGITVIRNSTFSSTALTEVVIPANVKDLERGAFSWCGELKSVAFHEGLTSIGRDAFYNCGKLTSLTIPSSVQRIDQGAFHGCGSLTSVTMLGERPNAPNNIFDRCGKLKAIHVPANAKSWAGMKEWFGIPLVFDGEQAAAKLLPESLSVGLEGALVGYWTFDGNANDATKNRNNGTLHGVTQTEDRYGNANKAYRFNGSGYIEVPHAETLNMTHAITMTAWIKPHNWWNRWIVVMQKGDQRNANYQFAMFRPNQINLHSGVCGECEKLGLELNKWQQVVLTYESGKSLCIYRNGVQVGKWQRSQDLQPNNCSLLIGYDPFVDPEYFIGDMDDVRLFNRALSEKEIKELYKAEAPSQDGVQQVVDGAAEQQQATVDGYTWSYRVENSEATIVAEKGGKYFCAVSPAPAGDISIPATLGGVKVTRIGRDAFAYCAGLKSATIPSSVRNIDSGAFANCGNLQSIVIPEGVESIKSGAFSWYCGVETVSISSTVTNIEQGAFCDCTKLRSFHVDPDNPCYRSINGLLCSKDGSYLVAGVNGDVMIPEGVATIGSDSFHGCFGLNSVLIPSSVTNIEHWALSFLPGLSSVRVDAANPAYKSVDGLLLTKDGRKLVRGVNGKVTIPDGVECIIDAAFSCSRVDSLAIPEGVTNIEHAAFYRCSGMQTVTIPSSVKNIGGAFGRCYDLTSVTMRGERPEAPNDIFMGCGKLKSIHVPANAKSWAGMEKWQGVPLVFDGAAAARLLPESLSAGLEGALVGYWTFDGNANDATKNRNNGALHGVTQTEDRYGNANKAYRFNGSSYIEVPHAETLNMTHAITMTAWIKPHNWWNNDWIVVMHKGDRYRCNYQPSMTINNAVFLSWHDGIIGKGRQLGLELNKWQQVALTYESGKSLCFYRNGVLIGTWQFAKDLRPNNGSLLVGYDPIGRAEYFIGDMDDVRLFNRALSEKEINELYKAEAPSPDGIQQVVGGMAESAEVKLPYEVVDGTVVLGKRLVYLTRNAPSTFRPRGSLNQKFVAVKYSSGELVIPDVVDGIPVRSIGYDAFAGCKGLKSVRIPGSVTNISGNAFGGSGIGAPFGRMERQRNRPDEFSGLKSFSVAADNPSYSSRNGMLCTKDGSILIVGVNGDVVIPECVTSIGDGAFCGCGGLTSVTIPNSVTNIGVDAFSSCTNLTSVTIPGSVTNICEGAFAGCDGLTSVTIPHSVTSIGGRAFSGCVGLESVTIPASVTNIGENAFGECRFDGRKFDGRRGVLKLQGDEVDKFSGLKSFSVAADNPSYSSRNGMLCTKDGSILIVGVNGDVVIPECVTSIGNGAFCGCGGLTSVTIPNGVTSIGVDAFSSCTNLTSVTIPNGVTSIGGGAFSGCIGLESVTISESVTNIGENAFGGLGGRRFSFFYGGLRMRGVKSDEFSGLKSFSVAADNPSYSSRNGMLCTKDGSILIVGVNGDVVIPECVTSIGNGAFYGCGGLTSVTIPNSVTNIEEAAFYFCTNLASVTIPDGLMSIEDEAFYGCSGLANVTIGNGVMSIGDAVFRDCSRLKSVTIPDGVKDIDAGAFYFCTNLTSVMIPNSVTNIGVFAFYGCSSLTSVTISNGVTDIGNRAFFGCSSLTNVTIGNGVTSIGFHAFSSCTNLMSVTIPNSVTNIHPLAFVGCNNLSSVDVLKEGKVEKLSFQDFCKQWKLGAGARRTFGPRLSLRGRLAPRETEGAAPKREEQPKQLRAIQEELRRVRESRAVRD